ncbi:hypothetical protein [Noviherbaspirillum cavernae]|uniref:hypothetical protein n=1 Tax=Noviherbaspirillum cavernae TaxID=2320862 RepID=UPI0018F3349A|nr:hypothetical protein [Noviherbaspirillum cavernae]
MTSAALLRFFTNTMPRWKKNATVADRNLIPRHSTLGCVRSMASNEDHEAGSTSTETDRATLIARPREDQSEFREKSTR